MHPDNKPKMSCEQAEALFSDLMEAALTEQEEAELRDHLEHCALCAQGYDDFKEAMTALSSYRPAPVPNAFIESVDRAAATTAGSRAGMWPLLVSWTLTAASVLIAVWVYLATPKQIEIMTPVDREVIVEKVREVEVPVPYEVEVIREVPVPMAATVSIPICQGGLQVVRNGNAFKVSAGESLEFLAGDEIRVVRTEPDASAAPPYAGMIIDFKPVASAIREAGSAALAVSKRVDQYRRDQHLLAAMASFRPDAPPSVGSPSQFQEPAGTPVPVELTWTSNNALALETTGPDHEVIPELIRMLEDPDPKVSAVALGMLETIQQRLQNEHGIAPPKEARQVTKKTNLLEDIRGLFNETKKGEPPAYSITEFWQRWWAMNRSSIMCLACLDM
ncbi:MAG: zf-HC2 domain-containing protein [Planctomycetota bacterium]